MLRVFINSQKGFIYRGVIYKSFYFASPGHTSLNLASISNRSHSITHGTQSSMVSSDINDDRTLATKILLTNKCILPPFTRI